MLMEARVGSTKKESYIMQCVPVVVANLTFQQ